MTEQRSSLSAAVQRATRWMFTRIIVALAATSRDEDLSVVHIATLQLVDEAGELGMAALSEALALSPSVTSRTIDALVQRGLVERREATHDRRARVVCLSARGQALVDRISEERAELILRIARPLPAPVLRTLVENLERIRTRHSAVTKERS
jgi:DNA-binding MarR family transcriptional regulator